MQARQLVEVAALLASHGPGLVEGSATVSPSALQQYWAASKCRCQRWLRPSSGWPLRKLPTLNIARPRPPKSGRCWKRSF